MKKLRGQAWISAILVATVLFITWRYRSNSAELDNAFTNYNPTDLSVYLIGGELVSRGKDLYSTALLGDLPFTYPPFAGFLFSLLPASSVIVPQVWMGAILLALIAVVWLSLRNLNTSAWPTTVLLLAAVAVAGTEPLHATLYWGQINIFLMLLVCLDFLPRKYRLPGIGIGLAAGLKLTPAFFILLLLLQRRFHAALIAGVTFVATVVIGFLTVTDADRFWTHAMFDSGRVGEAQNPGSQALKQVLERVFGVESTVVWLVTAVLVTALVAISAHCANQRDNLPLAVGFVGIGSCLVSPFSWYHHWVWIVPVALGVFVVVNRRVGGAISVVALAAIYLPYTALNVWHGLFARGAEGSFLEFVASLAYVFPAIIMMVVYVVWTIPVWRQHSRV